MSHIKKIIIYLQSALKTFNTLLFITFLSLVIEEIDVKAELTEKETPSISFSTETTTSWMKEAGMDADIRSYAKASLLRKDEYFFRIWHYAKKLFK